MLIESPASVHIPAGRYFLGDPCYAVPDDLWLPLLESCDYFNAPVGNVAGFRVVAFSTAYGDGEYLDNEGHRYPVDAGLIGVVPEAFATKYPREELERLGRFVEHDGCLLSSEDGVIRLGHIAINTGDGEDDDYLWFADCGDGEDE